MYFHWRLDFRLCDSDSFHRPVQKVMIFRWKSWFFVTHRGYQLTFQMFGLKQPLPPFAIHILNRLHMRIRQVPSKIYPTYKKKEQIAIECKVFGGIFGDFWGREPETLSYTTTFWDDCFFLFHWCLWLWWRISDDLEVSLKSGSCPTIRFDSIWDDCLYLKRQMWYWSCWPYVRQTHLMQQTGLMTAHKNRKPSE